MGSWVLTLDQTVSPIHTVGLAGFSWQFPNWVTQPSKQQAYFFDDVGIVQMALTTGTWLREKVTQLAISLHCSVGGVFIPGAQIGVSPQAVLADEATMDPTALVHFGGGSVALRYCKFSLPALGEQTFSKTLTGRDLATDMFLFGRVTSLADPQVYANAMRMGFGVWGQTQPNGLFEPDPVAMTVQLTALSFTLTTTPVYQDPDVGSGSGTDTTSWSSGWAQGA